MIQAFLLLVLLQWLGDLVAAALRLPVPGIRDPIARGFGIGTARAFQESEAAGTASGLAMGLNAVLTAILVPIVLALPSLSHHSPRGDLP
jgi:putative effector of murein hydrolase